MGYRPYADAPEPALTESRICFGIAWFTTEEDAQAFASAVKARDGRYNGGWLDGCPCGREPSRDMQHPELGKLHAVTYP